MDLDKLLIKVRQLRAEVEAKLNFVRPVANERFPEESLIA
jgi:hypothetical protein